jgi:hypothetical protein
VCFYFDNRLWREKAWGSFIRICFLNNGDEVFHISFKRQFFTFHLSKNCLNTFLKKKIPGILIRRWFCFKMFFITFMYCLTCSLLLWTLGIHDSSLGMSTVNWEMFIANWRMSTVTWKYN